MAYQPQPSGHPEFPVQHLGLLPEHLPRLAELGRVRILSPLDCSKTSLFFTTSWSSRLAVMTLASCFSRSACSASAFLLASATAFFSASYSALAPRAYHKNTSHYAQLSIRANFKTNGFNIHCLSSSCLFTRPSSSSARARLCFSSDTSAL